MAVLTFTGDQVAYWSNINDLGTATQFTGVTNPFLATDTIQIEIRDADIDSDGEFDPSYVEILSLSVTRGANTYNFSVSSEQVKESGGGSNKEQGDTFFVTNGSISPPSSGPFSGLPSQQKVFSSSDTFSTGSNTTIEREQDVDFNNDFDTTDPGETGNGNYNIQSGMVVCFTRGTRILTPVGEVPVETLQVGMLVTTLNSGDCKIRRIIRRKLNASSVPQRHKPVEFPAGSLGNGLPHRALAVSPQHKMLLKVPGRKHADHVLAPAKGLGHLTSVERRTQGQTLEYYHLVFDRHEVVFSEGVASESFFPGPVALRSLKTRIAEEICRIFDVRQADEAPTRQSRYPALTVAQTRQQFP